MLQFNSLLHQTCPPKPAQQCAKKNSEKFQPQPELGHQVPQELEDGHGVHGVGPGVRTEGDFGSIFFRLSS